MGALPKMSSLCSTTSQANNNTTDSSQRDAARQGQWVKGTRLLILGAISVSHLLNDMIQSLILAIYPDPASRFPPSVSCRSA